jgi:hypothetical protein
MKRPLSIVASLAVALMTTACGFEHTTSVLVPTSVPTSTGSTPTAGNGAGGPGAGSTQSTPSLVGTWASANATPTLPDPSTCGNFQYQITSQNTSSIAGTFTAVCGGGLAIAGSVTGQINGTAVSMTVSGTASMPGIPNCPFTLSGTGAIEDNGNTLRVPFTGTTCLGPVSGTEVLRRPQPAAQNSIGEPTPVSPSPNAHVDSVHPRFTVTNATRSGTVGAITYSIEVANDEAFTSQFATWTVGEQPNQTAFDLPRDLAYSSVYYWHVRASDPTTTGPWSRTLALATPNPPVVIIPSGQDAIDLRQVTVTGGNAVDVANWPVTTQIRVLDFRADGLFVDFDKKDGSGRWPDVTPAGWDGSIQYTMWMVVNIGGRWYTSGGVEYWHGLSRQGGPPSRYAANWYYSPEVWGPLASHQPAVGEQVGFFVTAGDQRAKDVRGVTERSNVVMVSFPSDAGGYYPF